MGSRRVTLTAALVAAPEAVRRPEGPSEGREGAPLGVVVMRAGTANGLSFGADVLERAAPLCAGVPSYVDHAAPADALRPGGRSVRDLAGALVAARYDGARRAIVGELRLFSRAAWVGALAREAAGLGPLGLSAVVWLDVQEGRVLRIREVESVDVVMNPAAGGRFLPHAARDLARTTPQEGATENMGTEITSTQEADTRTVRVASARPATREGDSLAPDAPTAGRERESASPDAAHDDHDALRERVDRLQMELSLERSGLPDEARADIRARFAGRAPDPRAVEEAIDLYRAALGRAAAAGSIRHLGRVTDVLAPVDRVTLALERLMGLPIEGRHSDVPRLTGIREAYDLLTGDWERRGVFRGDRVSLANASTTTMAQVVANVLNKVLLRQFEGRPRWWAPIAYEEDFSTLADVRWITVGGFSDLDAVPEGDPYTEKTWDDHAETSAFQKRGNYIGLTLEMIDRDDVAAVRAIPRRLGHAAYRTLSAAVAGLFAEESGTGPLLADGQRLFSEAHGNLGSSALGVEPWQATVAAMFKQQEFHSGRRLGVRPRYCLVPIDLEKAALEVFTSDVVPVDGAFYRNVLQRSSDSVVIVPDWTDATDWAAVADPAELEGVCVGYRFGRAPELFVADGELTGSMFTNDEMRIKCRFVFAVGVGDYRALYKHNVAD